MDIRKLKQLAEESPEMLQKIMRSLKGESDDAVQKLGSGKNLDALKAARENAPTKMPDVELPQQTSFQPGVGDAPLKTPINPDDLNVPASTYDDIDPLSINKPQNQFEVPMKRPEPIMSKEAAPGLATSADELQGSIDNMLDPNRKLKNIGLGAGVAAGGAGLMMMGDEDQKSKGGLIETAVMAGVPAIVDNLMSPSEPKLPRTPAVEKPLQAPNTKPVPEEIPAEDNYLSMMKDAQARQDELDFIDNMLRAGTTIGSAVAGQKADYTNVNALQKQNSKGVNDVKGLMTADMDAKKLKKVQAELDDDKKLRDPKSDVSQAFRQALSKLGIKHTDKTTAADAKAMGINIQNLLMHEKTTAATERKAELKAKKDVDGFVTGAQKSLMKPYQEYQKVATAKKALDGYLKGEANGPKDVAILYDFIRGLDPTSAVKEGEITLGKSAMSLFEQYGISAKKLTRGEVLSPQFRTAVADILKSKEVLARQGYEELSKPFLFEAAKRGIPEEDYARFDYMSAASSGKEEQDNTKQSAPMYSAAQQKAIQLVMSKNNVSEAEAVNALKKAGKLQ